MRSGKKDVSSQKEGNHKPDIIIYRKGPHSTPSPSPSSLSAVETTNITLKIIALIIELQWVQPLAPSPGDFTWYTDLRGRQTFLEILALEWAFREAVMQTLAYLCGAGPLAGAELAVAQINEFFFRCLRLPTGVLVVEAASLASTIDSSSERTNNQTEISPSGSGLTPQYDASSRPRLSVDEFESHQTFWKHAPHSLLHIVDEKLQIDEQATDILSAMIYIGMYFASTATRQSQTELTTPPISSRHRRPGNERSPHEYLDHVLGYTLDHSKEVSSDLWAARVRAHSKRRDIVKSNRQTSSKAAKGKGPSNVMAQGNDKESDLESDDDAGHGAGPGEGGGDTSQREGGAVGGSKDGSCGGRGSSFGSGSKGDQDRGLDPDSAPSQNPPGPQGDEAAMGPINYTCA